MFDNLPNLQPGQRIIVRHDNNGDTDYICRRDSSLDFASGGGIFDGLIKWVIIAILAAVIWNMLPASPAEKARMRNDFRQEQVVLGRE